MAVSILSDTDLRLIAKMNPEDVNRIVAGKSVNAALIFRRNIQITLSDYSKRHPAIGKFDEIQAGAIWICKQIEMKAQNTFTIMAWRQFKKHPFYMKMTEDEKWHNKIKIRDKWEKLLAQFSY